MITMTSPVEIVMKILVTFTEVAVDDEVGWWVWWPAQLKLWWQYWWAAQMMMTNGLGWGEVFYKALSQSQPNEKWWKLSVRNMRPDTPNNFSKSQYFSEQKSGSQTECQEIMNFVFSHRPGFEWKPHFICSIFTGASGAFWEAWQGQGNCEEGSREDSKGQRVFRLWLRFRRHLWVWGQWYQVKPFWQVISTAFLSCDKMIFWFVSVDRQKKYSTQYVANS